MEYWKSSSLEQVQFRDNIKKEYWDCLYAMFLITSWLIKEGILNEADFKNLGKQQKEKIFKRSSFLKRHEKPTVRKEEEEWYYSKNQPIKPI